MKYAILLFSLGLLLSCGEETPEKEEVEVTQTREELIEVKNGIYTEWYPGKKHWKFQGPQDKGGKRHGVWYFNDETGANISMTDYKHGLKNGLSIVKYPNGAIQYTGEYLDDKQVGEWKTYDPSGKVVDIRNYSDMTVTPLDSEKATATSTAPAKSAKK